MDSDEKMITVREAANECGKNPETVRRWIWSGRLPAQKLGNQLFVKKSDLAICCREFAASLVAAPSADASDSTDSEQEQLERRKAAMREFLDRAIALQTRMKSRGVRPLGPLETASHMWEERKDRI